MNLRIQAILAIIIAAAIARIAMAGVPNFSPVAALALFSGAYLADRKMAMLIPLAAMLIGDFILGLHASMLFVYASFALIVGLGVWLSSRLCGHLVIAASLVSSVLFFVITNFGVWAMLGYYPMTLEGLWMSYVAALPFFHMTLFGDLFFVSLLFGGMMAAEHYLPAFRRASHEGA